MTVQVKEGEREKLPPRHFSRSLASKMFCREKKMTNSCPAGGCDDSRALRQTLYQPPAPADIEKMRRNKMLEERAFALLKEILSTLFFFLSSRSSQRQTTKSNISLKFLPQKEMFPEQWSEKVLPLVTVEPCAYSYTTCFTAHMRACLSIEFHKGGKPCKRKTFHNFSRQIKKNHICRECFISFHV